jgi:hypothetical protein
MWSEMDTSASAHAHASNRFTGWVDVDLSIGGEQRARHSGELLREAGLLPTVLHTSLLPQVIRTGSLVLEAAGRSWVSVRRSWRLNERRYGALQGRDRREVRAEYGDELFQFWCRSSTCHRPAPGGQPVGDLRRPALRRSATGTPARHREPRRGRPTPPALLARRDSAQPAGGSHRTGHGAQQLPSRPGRQPGPVLFG